MRTRLRRGVRKVIVAATVVTAGVAVWATTSLGANKEGLMTSRPGSAVTPGVTPKDLAEVARAKVFFGHQSVGVNILDGVRDVYAAHGTAPPVIEQGALVPGSGGGFIDHAFIGENTKPLLKLQDFDATLRNSVGKSVDVALMKFCYVDITATTNVDELFAAYRATLANLQRDFPNVTFVHATVPLTTEQGILSRVKGWLTGSTSYKADNVARERFNQLIRHEYAGSHLLDLAAIESTTPDGARSGGTYEGQQYYSLYEGYASDPGHLNPEGAQVAASAWLKTVARAFEE